MSPGLHLDCNNFPGHAIPDRNCLPYARLSGRAVSYSSCEGSHILFQGASVFLKCFPVHSSRKVSLACTASSNSHRRNPDFSKQSKGFSKGKSRQFQGRDNSENLEETDTLSSKNGPILSLSSNQRNQTTATPGRREKEIVELFRKVQAQLRERAAVKEEKKIETSQQGQSEKGTVESLLKLLRKHSVDGKKGIQEEEYNLDQPERSNPFEDEHNSNYFESSDISEKAHEAESTPISRPASNFRRKSPVPRVKFQPVYSAEEGISADSSYKTHGRKKKATVRIEPDPESDLVVEPDDVILDDPSESSDTDETYEEAVEPAAMEATDLSSLKLSELRELAKSRGIRGYSKLKKANLVELLRRDEA